MLTDTRPAIPEAPYEVDAILELLVVDIAGTKIGFDIEQIEKIEDLAHPVNTGDSVLKLHEAIRFNNTDVRYKAPKLLFAKGSRGTGGLQIEQPKEILSVDLKTVHPLPPLVSETMQSPAIWGAVIVDGEIVFLLDFEKLTNLKTL